MLCHDLLFALPKAQVCGSTHQIITSIAYDSRRVQPGSLFVAIKGSHTDGHNYLAQAIAAGASAIVVDARFWPHLDQQPFAAENLTQIVVPDSRVALAPLAAAFYHYPAQALGMVGVTGTKGKTTTTTLISAALEGGGHSTGLISTVNLKIGDQFLPNQLRQSTPEALEIQSLLSKMVTANCTYAVLEASSHALAADWDRLAKCAFDVAVFTNVTHEHLDYHGTLEAYRQAKTRLFAMLGEESSSSLAFKKKKFAIVNADDPFHQLFLAAAPANAQRLTYAIHAPADLRAFDLELAPNKTKLRVTTPWGTRALNLQVPGPFNALNALAALSVALTQNVPLDQAIAALEKVKGVQGRMEYIEQGQPFGVLVDYAHNPDSFTQVMQMLRPLTKGRMLAVFGSAGERDRAKRPIQGQIAAKFCDLLILTDEDPRGEDSLKILQELAAGAEQAGKKLGKGYVIIPDRSEAIRSALTQAQAGDLVLLLGKGHEGSIEYATTKIPWNEAEVARVILSELGFKQTD